jgi:hypothetical protein
MRNFRDRALVYGTYGAAILAIALIFAPDAGAAPHGGGHMASPAGRMEPHAGFERHDGAELHRPPHMEFDGRFHHNHFYPALGFAVAALPLGYLAVDGLDGRYFFDAGVWYRNAGPDYVVVRPPLGLVAPVLPPDYTTVWGGGVPYYYANDTYYTAVPGGYAVSPEPTDPTAALPPQTAAPAAAGIWYYCDSAQKYYPYVSQCAEGWRTVPATPPQLQ